MQGPQDDVYSRRRLSRLPPLKSSENSGGILNHSGLKQSYSTRLRRFRQSFGTAPPRAVPVPMLVPNEAIRFVSGGSGRRPGANFGGYSVNVKVGCGQLRGIPIREARPVEAL